MGECGCRKPELKEKDKNGTKQRNITKRLIRRLRKYRKE